MNFLEAAKLLQEGKTVKRINKCGRNVYLSYAEYYSNLCTRTERPYTKGSYFDSELGLDDYFAEDWEEE